MFEIIGSILIDFFFYFIFVKSGAAVRFLWFLLIGRPRTFKEILEERNFTNGIIGFVITVLFIALILWAIKN